MSLSYLDMFLWAASFLAHLCLLAVLILRERWRQYFWFTFLIVFMAFGTVLLFFVYRLGTKHGYFIAYWITGFLHFPIDCLVVAEVVRIQLGPLRAILKDNQRYFWTFWLVIVGTFAIVTLGISMGNAKGFDLWENRISVFTSLMLVSVIAFFRVLLSRFYIKSQRHTAAVEVGYFVVQYSILLGDVAKAFFHFQRDPAVVLYGQEFLYLGVLVFWIIAFWRNEQQPLPPTPEMLRFMSAMHEKVRNDLGSLERGDR